MWGGARIRPSRAVSIAGMVIGIVFIMIGLFIVISAAGPFGIFWTLVAGAITVYNAVNVFSQRGVSHEVVEFEGDLNRSAVAVPATAKRETPGKTGG